MNLKQCHLRVLGQEYDYGTDDDDAPDKGVKVRSPSPVVFAGAVLREPDGDACRKQNVVKQEVVTFTLKQLQQKRSTIMTQKMMLHKKITICS